jgi:thiosulfate dehydrogenase [quinone] large subunit
MGSMATITLPVTSNADPGSLHSAATLQLHTVNGNTFDVAIRTA